MCVCVLLSALQLLCAGTGQSPVGRSSQSDYGEVKGSRCSDTGLQEENGSFFSSSFRIGPDKTNRTRVKRRKLSINQGFEM